MSEKINLEEIILKHLKYDDSLDGFKEAMLDFGQQILELASENATYDWNDHEDIIIDKQSILDTIKQIE